MNKYIPPLLHHFEGCKLEAYLDGGNVPTIGFGNTYYSDGSRVKLGDKITQEQADEEFERDVKEFTGCVLSYVKVPITDYEEAALVSLSYNIGLANFEKSTLLKELNYGNYEGAANEFKWWRKVGGDVSKGLATRRHSEANLFRGNTEDYIVYHVPDNWRELWYDEK